MEYLPWVVMAFGLFLLFVKRKVRERESVSDETMYTHIAYSQHPNERSPKINAKVLEELKAAHAAHAAHAPPEAPASAVWMPILLSLLITGAALTVILLPTYYGEAQQKWAFGIIGVILGYWFKK